jgi:hypothetical protein
MQNNSYLFIYNPKLVADNPINYVHAITAFNTNCVASRGTNFAQAIELLNQREKYAGIVLSANSNTLSDVELSTLIQVGFAKGNPNIVIYDSGLVKNSLRDTNSDNVKYHPNVFSLDGVVSASCSQDIKDTFNLS